MKAIGVYRNLPSSHPESLVDLDIPETLPGPHDLLVQVEAISVNPADCRARNRKADDGTYSILGWDAAGTVTSVGSAVSVAFKPGGAVYYAGDLSRPGANSELHVVDARIVGHRPATLNATEAAALPLTGLTAWEALFERIGFQTDRPNRLKNLLIVGSAGGAGSMAIQLAKLVPDLLVIATASRAASQAWCLRMGADAVVNHAADLPSQLKRLNLSTVDAVLILSSPDSIFPVLADIISPQGTICSVVPFDTPPDMNLIMRKSVTFVWEFMFTRSLFKTADMQKQRDILNTLSELADSGKIQTTAAEDLGRINAHNLRAAHAALETGRTIGKLTLTGF